MEAWSIILASKPPGISIIEENLSADSLKRMVENLSQSSYKLNLYFTYDSLLDFAFRIELYC